MRAEAALARFERDDPTGHAMHLAAAAAWGFCQSIANSPEGIAWSVLLVVTLLRLPKIHAAFTPALRDPAWWLLLLWMGWTMLSVSWTHPAVDRLDALRPMRWLLTPLLLWPVMGYPWLVLGAIAAGGLVQAISAILMSIGSEGLLTYSNMRSLAGFGQLTTIVGSLLVISLGALALPAMAPIRRQLTLLGSSVIAGFVIMQSAARSAFIAAALGILILAFRSTRPGLTRRMFSLSMVVLTVALVTHLAGIGATVLERSKAEIDRIGQVDRELLIVQSGTHRGVFWVAAWELGWRRPLLGHGAHAYGPLLEEWSVDAARKRPDLSYLVETLRDINHAHNAVLHAWVEGGLPSVVFLSSGLVILSVRVWRRGGTDATDATAAALLAIVLVAAMVGIFESKAPGALLAVVMAISWRPPGNS